MEKINALIDKLQELKNDQAGLHSLSYYTQLLYAEIMYALSEPPQPAVRSKVAVILPGNVPRQHNGTAQPRASAQSALSPTSQDTAPAAATEKVSSPAASPETPRQAPAPPPAEAAVHAPAPFLSPTPVLPKELNETMAQEGNRSLNDLLKEEKTELARKLGETRIADLHKAIGINDKFQFISELFRGDREMYERSVKAINDFPDLQQAGSWMERELKNKLGWQDTNGLVQQFYSLVRKRFS